MRMLRTILLILPILLLGACDYVAQKTLEPGVSTEKEVRSLMGRPEIIWADEDGTRVLEYVRGPMGHETYMVTIGPDGLFRSMETVLTKTRFAQIKAGMKRDHVRRLLGKPSEIVFFSLSKQEVWSFRHVGDISDSDMFNVHFDMAGNVIKVSLTRDPEMDNA